MAKLLFIASPGLGFRSRQLHLITFGLLSWAPKKSFPTEWANLSNAVYFPY